MTDEDWDEAASITAADDADEAHTRELELQYEYDRGVEDDD